MYKPGDKVKWNGANHIVSGSVGGESYRLRGQGRTLIPASEITPAVDRQAEAKKAAEARKAAQREKTNERIASMHAKASKAKQGE